MAIIYNGSTISWAFILYTIVAIAITFTVVKYFYGREQQIAAISLLLLLFFVFLFYNLRWFTNFQLKGSAGSTTTSSTTAASSCGSSSSTTTVGAPSSWPPIVNMCPDFMVTWKDTAGNIFCYDTSNLYNLSSTSPNITSITIPGVGNKPAYLIKNGTAAGNPTSLNDPNATAMWPFLKSLLSGAIPLSDPSMRYIRWEGVWNGFKLAVANAPLP